MANSKPPPVTSQRPPLVIPVVKRSPRGHKMGKGNKAPVGSKHPRMLVARPFDDNLRDKGGGQVITFEQPDARTAFLDLLEKGATPQSAAKVVGFKGNHLMLAMARDPELREAVERSREKAKNTLVQKIHTNPDWKAASWMLAKLWPEEFAEKNLTEAEAREIILRCKQIAQLAMEQSGLPTNLITTILKKMDDQMYPTQITDVVVTFDESTDTQLPVHADATIVPDSDHSQKNAVPIETQILKGRKKKANARDAAPDPKMLMLPMNEGGTE